LLKQLCQIHGPSGNEGAVKDFILQYVEANKHSWAVVPEVFHGDEFQDCVVLVFGKQPKTAIFAHIDSIGFMVGYHRELIKIGGPRTKQGFELVGEDSQGPIECDIEMSGDQAFYRFDREIDRGTELVFKCDFRTSDNYVQSCYLDNRLGCWIALKTAETLESGIICFSCWEEHGGGSVPYLAKFIYEQYGVKQALISDITWVTEGVKHGKGVAISLKDKAIPRRAYTNRVRKLAEEAGIPFQIEVEHTGGSDGIELQNSPYPFDWCFIGPPEHHVHTPDEKVHKFDIQCALDLYQYLMRHL
jgi:putative aminopeptidase FrvX